MMRLLIQSFNTPEENLACEEYLFRKLNQEPILEGILRIWESPVYFVAIGNSQKVKEVVYIEECEKNNIKVIRRCSAGGAVLQGPGCLNFSLFYFLDNHPELRNIQNSYNQILGSIVRVILDRHNVNTHIEGLCDIVYHNRKVSGNAQRRNNKVLLHHGTLLWNPNYDLMEKTLKIPIEQPAYRMNRSHREFVGALPFNKEQLIEIVIKTFCNKITQYELNYKETQEIRQLVEEKYSKSEWNFRK